MPRGAATALVEAELALRALTARVLRDLGYNVLAVEASLVRKRSSLCWRKYNRCNRC